MSVVYGDMEGSKERIIAEVKVGGTLYTSH